MELVGQWVPMFRARAAHLTKLAESTRALVALDHALAALDWVLVVLDRVLATLDTTR